MYFFAQYRVDNTLYPVSSVSSTYMYLFKTAQNNIEYSEHKSSKLTMMSLIASITQCILLVFSITAFVSIMAPALIMAPSFLASECVNIFGDTYVMRGETLARDGCHRQRLLALKPKQC